MSLFKFHKGFLANRYDVYCRENDEWQWIGQVKKVLLRGRTLGWSHPGQDWVFRTRVEAAAHLERLSKDSR